MKALIILLAFTINLSAVNLPPWDKFAHFNAGAIISTSITFKIRNKNQNSPFFGIGAGIGAGYLKEVFDAYTKGTPSQADINFTTAGSVIGGISCFISLNPQYGARYKKKHKIILYNDF